MLTTSICKKSLDEILEISYENPPYLTPRQFTLSTVSITNIIGVIPHGLAIGLAIVAKHFIIEKKLYEYTVKDQITMFTNEIERFFVSYKNRPEDALNGLISYIHMEATGKCLIGGEINLAIDNCISAGNHFEWYRDKADEAIRGGLIINKETKRYNNGENQMTMLRMDKNHLRIIENEIAFYKFPFEFERALVVENSTFLIDGLNAIRRAKSDRKVDREASAKIVCKEYFANCIDPLRMEEDSIEISRSKMYLTKVILSELVDYEKKNSYDDEIATLAECYMDYFNWKF